MTTEPSLEAIAAPSDLAELHDLVVGDAITARTFDVDPASASAIAATSRTPQRTTARQRSPSPQQHRRSPACGTARRRRQGARSRR